MADKRKKGIKVIPLFGDDVGSALPVKHLRDAEWSTNVGTIDAGSKDDAGWAFEFDDDDAIWEMTLSGIVDNDNETNTKWICTDFEDQYLARTTKTAVWRAESTDREKTGTYKVTDYQETANRGGIWEWNATIRGQGVYAVAVTA